MINRFAKRLTTAPGKVERVDFLVSRPYAYGISIRGNVIVYRLRALLMVLIVLRLLMPPGICACKWSSPAARLLIALTQCDRQIPLDQQRDNDDDHDAGCPASPLATGMGVKPPCEPLLPPALALDPPPLPPQATLFLGSNLSEWEVPNPSATLSIPLYLTVRTLLL